MFARERLCLGHDLLLGYQYGPRARACISSGLIARDPRASRASGGENRARCVGVLDPCAAGVMGRTERGADSVLIGCSCQTPQGPGKESTLARALCSNHLRTVELVYFKVYNIVIHEKYCEMWGNPRNTGVIVFHVFHSISQNLQTS